jgi:hypothetical protein
VKKEEAGDQMSGFWRRLMGIFGVAGFLVAAPAGAQENLDSGKTGAQLFASNCALCHKSVQALSKSGGIFGLSSFLREHYTASRESADIIATYVQSFGNAPAPAKRTGAAKRTAKGDEKAKTSGPKTSGPKTSEPKTSEPETGPKSEAQPSEAKPDEAKPAEPKANDAKAAAPKPPEAKTSEPKPDAAPAAKPEKSD